jgi:hypothetical protein
MNEKTTATNGARSGQDGMRVPSHGGGLSRPLPASEPAPRVMVQPLASGAGFSVAPEDAEGDAAHWRTQFLNAFGTTEPAIANALLSQLVSVLHTDPSQPLDPDTANLALGLLHRMAPRDEIEAMLCVQMVVAHFASVDASRLALHTAQTPGGRQAYLSLARKLMSLFVSQIDALHRGRGQGVVQTVVVERFNVEAGGRAIVGAVANPQGRTGGA